jgi:hypothetical protein
MNLHRKRILPDPPQVCGGEGEEQEVCLHEPDVLADKRGVVIVDYSDGLGGKITHFGWN